MPKKIININIPEEVLINTHWYNEAEKYLIRFSICFIAFIILILIIIYYSSYHNTDKASDYIATHTKIIGILVFSLSLSLNFLNERKDRNLTPYANFYCNNNECGNAKNMLKRSSTTLAQKISRRVSNMFTNTKTKNEVPTINVKSKPILEPLSSLSQIPEIPEESNNFT